MTNDELEAIRARAENDDGWHDVADDAFALLDEVERFREGHEIVARIWKILGSPTYEELQGDTIYDVIEKRLACATRAEAHAERLAGALEAFVNSAKTHPRMGGDTTFAGFMQSVLKDAWEQARQALSAYNSGKVD